MGRPVPSTRTRRGASRGAPMLRLRIGFVLIAIVLSFFGARLVQLQGVDGNKAQAWLTLGEVVAVHIDKAFIKDGVYQTALAHPIVRAGRQGDYFEIKPENMFEMKRPD